MEKLSPNISVLIIAHNEEGYIRACLESMLNQTRRADEIILVAHNSTDQTVEIAKTYPINVITYRGPVGIAYARLRGLQAVSGDVVLCIDGDSNAAPNWIESLVELLQQRDNRLVGSWVRLQGNWFVRLTSKLHRYACSGRNKAARSWIWGQSLGFWKKDILQVQAILEHSISLSKQLNLSRNPDDYWLALFMSRIGNCEVTNQTFVTSNTKEVSLWGGFKRNLENMGNGKRMLRYFNAHPRLTF